jgi:hypothetical protein
MPQRLDGVTIKGFGPVDEVYRGYRIAVKEQSGCVARVATLVVIDQRLGFRSRPSANCVRACVFANGQRKRIR